MRNSLVHCLKRIRIIILFVLILPVFLTSCDPKYGHYPSQLASKWVCTAPEFTIEYSRNASGVLEDSAILRWNEESIPVDLAFDSVSFWLLPESSEDYDDRLLFGTWEYRDENLVLVIEEDFIFENQFSELVFSPLELEESTEDGTHAPE